MFQKLIKDNNISYGNKLSVKTLNKQNIEKVFENISNNQIINFNIANTEDITHEIFSNCSNNLYEGVKNNNPINIPVTSKNNTQIIDEDGKFITDIINKNNEVLIDENGHAGLGFKDVPLSVIHIRNQVEFETTFGNGSDITILKDTTILLDVCQSGGTFDNFQNDINGVNTYQNYVLQNNVTIESNVKIYGVNKDTVIISRGVDQKKFIIQGQHNIDCKGWSFDGRSGCTNFTKAGRHLGGLFDTLQNNAFDVDVTLALNVGSTKLKLNCGIINCYATNGGAIRGGQTSLAISGNPSSTIITTFGDYLTELSSAKYLRINDKKYSITGLSLIVGSTWIYLKESTTITSGNLIFIPEVQAQNISHCEADNGGAVTFCAGDLKAEYCFGGGGFGGAYNSCNYSVKLVADYCIAKRSGGGSYSCNYVKEIISTNCYIESTNVPFSIEGGGASSCSNVEKITSINCRVEENTGAGFCRGGGAYGCNNVKEIYNENCNAFNQGGGASGCNYVGKLHNVRCSVLIGYGGYGGGSHNCDYCTIINDYCSSTLFGGGSYYCEYCTIISNNCFAEGQVGSGLNLSKGGGGAYYCNYCTITTNKCSTNHSGGGTCNCNHSTLNANDCSANTNGGGSNNCDNCTFIGTWSGNSASSGDNIYIDQMINGITQGAENLVLSGIFISASPTNRFLYDAGNFANINYIF